MQKEGQDKMAQSKKDEVIALLFERDNEKVHDIKFFVGTQSSLVPEDRLWGEILSALIQEREGTARISTSFTDPARIQSGREFLKTL